MPGPAKKAPAKKAPAKKSSAKKPSSKGPTKADAGQKPPPSTSSGGDWRGQTLLRLRTLIKEAVPGVEEEAKWKKASNPAGVPTFSYDGIICTGETYRDKVKLTFARGAALKDPAHLFNSSLDGGTRRAIDFHEGGKLNEKALKTLFKDAAALNSLHKK
jgi:hypothetical protein